MKVESVPLVPLCLEFLLDASGVLSFHDNLTPAVDTAMQLIRAHGTPAAVETARVETYALADVLMSAYGAVEAAQQLRTALAAAGLQPPRRQPGVDSAEFRRFADAVAARRAPRHDAPPPPTALKAHQFMRPGEAEARRVSGGRRPTPKRRSFGG